MGIEEDVGQGGAQPARKIKNDKADRTKIVLDVVAEDPREDECDQVSVRAGLMGFSSILFRASAARPAAF